jgi:hypothetical protein
MVCQEKVFTAIARQLDSHNKKDIYNVKDPFRFVISKRVI